jgi:hypothetical protein
MLRRILQASLLALVASAPFSVQAASGVAGSAVVAAVQPGRVADLVLLDGGFDAGLRQGMVCRVMRGTAEIAEIILVDLRPGCSSALIVSVAAKQSIRAGDVARIKILKT